MNPPLKQTLEIVISYLEKQGVVVDYNELHTHIVSNTTTFSNEPKKKTFKIKPKRKSLSNTNTSKVKKIKFKPKLKSKQNDYQRFVDICNTNNLYFFQFNDEFNWKGPSIKIDIDNFDLSIFDNLEIHILEGYGFGILRPKNNESDKKIVYNEINYDNCKLLEEDIHSLNGSDDENDVYQAETDCDDDDAVLTEDWTHIPDNVIYQIDRKTNNIYCNQTNQYVGKKIDDFNIDYESKEHESTTIESF
jgi:hypothetical protein